MSPNDCPRCKVRGTPESFSSNPICAFAVNPAVFSKHNWNCATVNELRRLETYVDSNRGVTLTYSEDHNLMTIPIGHIYTNPNEDRTIGYFLTIGWYKSRGATDYIQVHDVASSKPITLEEAELIIERYELGAH